MKFNRLSDNLFTKFLNKGHARSVKAKKNILVSLFIKGFDVLIGLLLVRFSLQLLSEIEYGIWLTISSMIAWFGFLDVGLGHGLRNKFAEAKAKGEDKKARIYVSTTYFILSIIAVTFFVIFLAINHFLPWSKILNVEAGMNAQLSLLAIIVFGSFSFNFVARLITIIILADQKPAIRDAINFSGKVFVVIAIYILLKLKIDSLIYVGLAYTGFPLLVLIFSTFYFFLTKYSYYKPAIKFVDFRYFKDLMNLGVKFFILQIGAIVLIATDNIIITQIFSPKEVTPYQVANKYFSLVLILYLLILAPLWSTVTEAFKKNELNWIKGTIRKYLKLSLIFTVIIFIMILVSDFFYKIWLGNDIYVPKLVSIFWGIFVTIQLYNSIFTHFLNGIGKLNLSIYTASFTIIMNIPLSILFSKYLNLQTAGVILATNISILLAGIMRSIQYHKIINKRTIGIWSK